MKKNKILALSIALLLAACTGSPNESKGSEQKSQSTTSQNSSSQAGSSVTLPSIPAGSKVKAEIVDGKVAFRVDVNDATGWNQGSGKMNGKPNADGTPTSSSMSTWDITGAIPAGTYDVYMIGHMSASGHSSRHWNNHTAMGGEDTATENPDKSTEDPYRYFLKINGASAAAIYPNVTETWGELGFDDSTNKPGLMIRGMTMPAGATSLHLLHGNIGYSMYVESIRLVQVSGGSQASSSQAGSSSAPAAGSSINPAMQSETSGQSVTRGDQSITLTKNHEGAEVSILHPGIQQYCDDMYAAYDRQDPTHANLYKIQEVAKSKSGYMCPDVFAQSYQGPSNDRDRDNFQPIELTWNAPSAYSGGYVVKYSTNADLTDWKGITVSTNKAELVNLYTDTVYYWKVETTAGNHDSAIGSFKTKGHFRDISAGPAYNVRDMGGKMTSSGRRTKQGLIFRGGELTDHAFDGTIPHIQKHIVTCDATTVKVLHDDMKVRNEIDIRNGGMETDNQSKSYLGNDVTFNKLPTGSGFATMWNISNGTQKANLKSIFKMFGQATKNSAVYYHCWGGADRTGTSCFILNGLLGVSFLEACMDYEFTSFDTIHTRIRTDRYSDASGSYDFTSLISAIKSSSYYTQSSTKTFQDVCYRWCKGQLGLTDAEITTIQENLLEPASN